MRREVSQRTWTAHERRVMSLIISGSVIIACLSFIATLAAGCGDVHDPHVHLDDAARDARVPVADACVDELDAGSGDCCALLPYVDAVRACGAPSPGVCTTIVCHLRDCSVLALDVCVPPADAGPGPDGAP